MLANRPARHAVRCDRACRTGVPPGLVASYVAGCLMVIVQSGMRSRRIDPAYRPTLQIEPPLIS